ncbi:MAG: DUF6998 domain-containing protein [Chloroflexota bacterium]
MTSSDFPKNPLSLAEIGQLIEPIKEIAKTYRQLTGRPLGITGEVAEYEAARLLGLRLSEVRQAGYDATDADGRKIQVKGRVVFKDSKPGQRVGAIRLEHDWDVVVLVLLDADFNPTQIYEAQRPEVEAALLAPGSRARNERGALGINKFKSIGRLVWSRDAEQAGQL